MSRQGKVTSHDDLSFDYSGRQARGHSRCSGHGVGVRLWVSALENELPLQREDGRLRPWLRQEVLSGKHGPQRSIYLER